MKRPVAHKHKWAVIDYADPNKPRLYESKGKADAVCAGLVASGRRAYFLPPVSAWGGKDPDWWPTAVGLGR
jgi:hypothetical protein